MIDSLGLLEMMQVTTGIYLMRYKGSPGVRGRGGGERPTTSSLVIDPLTADQDQSFSSMTWRAFLRFKASSSFDIFACPGVSPASPSAATPIKLRIPADSRGFSNTPCLR